MLANSDIQKLYISNYYSVDRVTSDTIVSKNNIRINAIIMLALIFTVLIAIRLIYLNTINSNFLMKQMDSRIQRTLHIPAMRGNISDRLGNPLAVSAPVSSIWVDPSELDNLTSEQIIQVAKILGMPVALVNKKLNEKNKTFVYLKRAVSPKQASSIKSLDIKGIYSLQEFKRFYPNGEVGAHVVGFTNIDDQGSEGIEYANNKNLVGHNGLQQIIRDRQGNVVENLRNVIPVENGNDITLSIDNRIQYLTHNILKDQVTKSQAKGGSAVVLDAKTGEVLAMVNFPTYNPNNRVGMTPNMTRNRAAIDLYEPGSTIKPLLIAKALDKKLVKSNTIFNTEPLKVGHKIIRDDKSFPFLSVSQILEKSSDIGVAKIAFKMSPEEMWQYYKTVGFGHKIGTGFPGEAQGSLLPWQKWYPIDQASMSYGYAISVSLMQMARAYTVFTNNGCLLPISFYKMSNTDNPMCEQIIKPSTVATMQSILGKVNTDGTGKRARVDGYTSAGKTGTAQKLTNHGYSSAHHVGSYIGYAPAKNPKIVVAIMIDDPQKGSHYGSAIAAPVFSKIVSPTLHLLGVTPDSQEVEINV